MKSFTSRGFNRSTGISAVIKSLVWFFIGDILESPNKVLRLWFLVLLFVTRIIVVVFGRKPSYCLTDSPQNRSVQMHDFPRSSSYSALAVYPRLEHQVENIFFPYITLSNRHKVPYNPVDEEKQYLHQ